MTFSVHWVHGTSITWCVSVLVHSWSHLFIGDKITDDSQNCYPQDSLVQEVATENLSMKIVIKKFQFCFGVVLSCVESLLRCNSKWPLTWFMLKYEPHNPTMHCWYCWLITMEVHTWAQVIDRWANNFLLSFFHLPAKKYHLIDNFCLISCFLFHLLIHTFHRFW
jgi:hypothetical protein